MSMFSGINGVGSPPKATSSRITLDDMATYSAGVKSSTVRISGKSVAVQVADEPCPVFGSQQPLLAGIHADGDHDPLEKFEALVHDDFVSQRERVERARKQGGSAVGVVCGLHRMQGMKIWGE